MTDTIQVGPNATATQVVSAGSRPMLITNNGPATVFFGDDNAIRAGDASGIVAVAVNGYFTVDGLTDLFACVATGQTAQLALISGGQNFFAPTNLGLLGGAAVFVQAAAPVSTTTNPIPLNSLWLNTTLGALEIWNGAAWVVQTFTGSQLIAAGTIVANLIAAGVIVAGIVNGTLIQGAELLAGTAPNTQIAITAASNIGIIDFMMNSASFTDAIFSSIVTTFAQLNLGGPASTTTGHTDSVAQQWNSGGVGSANGSLIYHDAAGTTHFYLAWGAGGVSAIGNITAVHPGTGTVATPAVQEGWQTPALLNGWTAGGPIVGGIRYRIIGIGAGVLEIEGDIFNAGGVGNTIAAVLGAAYVTALAGKTRNLETTVNQNLVNNSPSTPWAFVDSTGNINIISYQAGGKEIFFHGFIPLD